MECQQQTYYVEECFSREEMGKKLNELCGMKNHLHRI